MPSEVADSTWLAENDAVNAQCGRTVSDEDSRSAAEGRSSAEVGGAIGPEKGSAGKGVRSQIGRLGNILSAVGGTEIRMQLGCFLRLG